MHNKIGISYKFIQAFYWAFGLRITEHGLIFVKLIILARLLTPADFGLFGIAMLTIAMLETISATGFSIALIQKRESIRDYLDTVWVVNLIRGSLITLIMVICSPYVGLFFEEPAVIDLVIVISFVPLLRGFSNPAVIFFQKEMDFRKDSIYRIPGLFTDIIISISLAFLFNTVWALILGAIAREAVLLIVSFIIHPQKPALQFNKSQFKELYNYGKWINRTNIVYFISVNGDDILVGKFLGNTALGFYQVAYRITSLLVNDISNILERVSLPAYSNLQEDMTDFKKKFFYIFEFNVAYMSPVTVYLILFAEPLILFILGEQWLPITTILIILSISAFFRGISNSAGVTFTSYGEPRINFLLNFVRMMVLLISIFPLIYFLNLEGAAFSVLLSLLALVPIWVFYLKKYFQIQISDLVIKIYPYWLIVFIVAIITLFMMNYLDVSNFVTFLAASLAYFICLVITTFFVWKYGKIGYGSLYHKFRLINKNPDQSK